MARSPRQRKLQEYDLLQRVTSIDHPDSGLSTFEHDDNGLLTRQVDGAGNVLARSYDGTGRLLTFGPEDGTPHFTYTYDYDWSGACPSLMRS